MTHPKMLRQRLKILCLHGYRQNENIFRQKTGGLRRTLKNYAEFDFIDAPHIVPQCDDIDVDDNDKSETGDKFGWWLFPKDQTTGSTSCEGIEKSIELIEKTFQEKGPFDGILAFSQGATFAGILSILQQENTLSATFKFVIIIAGAHSLWQPLSQYKEKIITIPSLHIIGETDQIIPRERSEAFLKCFPLARCQTHPGGHYVAASASLKNTYIDFIKEQTEKQDAK